MPLEIHIPHGSASPVIEASLGHSEGVSNEELGSWIVEGFMADFPMVGEVPEPHHEVTIQVRQNMIKEKGGGIPWFEESHLREGVRGWKFFSTLIEDKILKKDVMPYTREGKSGFRFSVTLFTERVRRHSLAQQHDIGVDDVARTVGRYIRLWLLRQEHPTMEVEGRMLGEYKDDGSPDGFHLFGLAVDHFWLEREPAASGD